MERWIDKMKILGMSVMRCMADGLGMSQSEWEDLRGLTDDSFWVMRVIGTLISRFVAVTVWTLYACMRSNDADEECLGYPPLPDGADGISCGSHKDYGCLTCVVFLAIHHDHHHLLVNDVPTASVYQSYADTELSNPQIPPRRSNTIVPPSPTRHQHQNLIPVSHRIRNRNRTKHSNRDIHQRDPPPKHANSKHWLNVGNMVRRVVSCNDSSSDP